MMEERHLIEIDRGPHSEEFMVLTDMQKRFVTAMIVVGAKRDYGAEAARLAGYEPKWARQKAYELMHHPKVLAAIRREADLKLQASVLLGTQVLEEIALDEKHKDRLKAATELLNRGGMMLIQRVEHTHKDDRTAAELVNFIRTLAVRNGMDPQKLLGHTEEVEDADYDEVDPEFLAMMGEADAEE
jgi:phage terminase small subunit